MKARGGIMKDRSESTVISSTREISRVKERGKRGQRKTALDSKRENRGRERGRWRKK